MPAGGGLSRARPVPAAERERRSRLAALATDTARAVGDAIETGDVGIVTRKAGRANFATAADHAAEKAIIARLRAGAPDVPVLAEETATQAARRADRLWVVDPIDGTLNFSRGLPFYCVAIGYVEGGRVLAGTVHAPRTGETFSASLGGGATLNGVPLQVSRVRRASEAFAVASLPFRGASRRGSRFAMVNATCARLRVVGSAALEIAYVAAGRFDLFVHEALSPWDVAGPSLIAREAGAAVRSLDTGEDAAWDERRVVIGNPALVRDALKAMPLVRPPRRG
ncbi:MAG TPA: inositol monophosphatase family protein [Candidatus Limnocylindrales bacterium]|nr:inositol monophosphatase family protein [Candidatus Limnocylindrales bacterium]